MVVISTGPSFEIALMPKSIDTSGNVTMAGSVTATTGTIGGFHINANNFWGGHPTIGNAATKIVFGQIQDGCFESHSMSIEPAPDLEIPSYH